MSVSSRSRVARAEQVAWVASTERVALLRLDDLSAPPVVLAGSAGIIWQLLEGAMTVDQLTTQVSEAFAVASDDVRGAVAVFVAECVEQGIMRAGD